MKKWRKRKRERERREECFSRNFVCTSTFRYSLLFYDRAVHFPIPQASYRIELEINSHYGYIRAREFSEIARKWKHIGTETRALRREERAVKRFRAKTVLRKNSSLDSSSFLTTKSVSSARWICSQISPSLAHLDTWLHVIRTTLVTRARAFLDAVPDA